MEQFVASKGNEVNLNMLYSLFFSTIIRLNK